MRRPSWRRRSRPSTRSTPATRRVGFDWPGDGGPRRKLDGAPAAGDAEAIRAELGDVLWSAGNVVRHAGVNPELALRGTVDRFMRRLAAVEEICNGWLAGGPLAMLEAA